MKKYILAALSSLCSLCFAGHLDNIKSPKPLGINLATCPISYGQIPTALPKDCLEEDLDHNLSRFLIYSCDADYQNSSDLKKRMLKTNLYIMWSRAAQATSRNSDEMTDMVKRRLQNIVYITTVGRFSYFMKERAKMANPELVSKESAAALWEDLHGMYTTIIKQAQGDLLVDLHAQQIFNLIPIE